MCKFDREFFLKEWSDNTAVQMPVHTKPCKNCPSANGHDEETKDLKACIPDDLLKLTVFPCAWRPERVCKGYVDLMEIK